MKEYRNKKTGIVITVESEIHGKDWEAVNVAKSEPKEEPKKEQPKKKAKK